ncbi:MAG: type III-A CRISPR-associated protein Cas10/Csm1 [Nitrospira sp.]|nr:type III-A CRISPR-associated protein Cas10/Csm1 [Nitrospira sp.]
MSQLLDASCRVALAALLHDLGKFAERARIPEAEQRDSHGTARLDLNVPLYCPTFQGRHTHLHAAYTAIAIDLLATHLPELFGDHMAPFAPWRDKHAEDSLINAAAKHHRPETFLQWVIATADRLASGFGCEQFASYNGSEEGTETTKTHYTVRQLTLFEQIRLNQPPNEAPLLWRYRLSPLSPSVIFPVKAEDYEPRDAERGQQEYWELWQAFREGLSKIPQSHRQSLPLWLDHFESCWLIYAHAIPSATAFGTNPDVSLYDHAKTVAALAVALWRWYTNHGSATDQAREQLRLMWDKNRQSTPEAEQVWHEPTFLLIQGDFWGIQDFILATGGETQRQTAKLLRGRSFYVSLLTECAALKVLEALHLPSTSQVVNAAGKFLIVAPHTEQVIAQLRAIQRELDQWFLEHTFGQSGIGLTWLPAAATDFRCGEQGASPFRALMKRLFEQLETAKFQRFGLCQPDGPSALFCTYLKRFDRTKGVCAIDGRSPATERLPDEQDVWVSPLAADQIETGKYLTVFERLLITRTPLHHHTLRLPVFGYWINFSTEEEISGRFGREAESDNLVRAWDFSLPTAEDPSLWHGYARRHINAYIARFGTLTDYDRDRYRHIQNGHEPASPHEPKTLNHLALDDRERIREAPGRYRWIGLEALTTMKGDVDNLGRIFQNGLEQPTFAKMAALSRQMHAFFTIWLPWCCANEFRNTYTVFAGGDDFFLIGPWHSTMRLALHMRNAFRNYVAANPDLHFSAGLSMTKFHLPLRELARLAEEALEQAKGRATQTEHGAVLHKNAVTCFGQTVPWQAYDDLLTQRVPALSKLVKEHGLTTGYLYDCLRYTDMEGRGRNEALPLSAQVRHSLWHSQFAYRTRRLAEAKIQGKRNRAQLEQERRKLQEILASEIAINGIQTYGAAYKIALFTLFYQQRS